MTSRSASPSSIPIAEISNHDNQNTLNSSSDHPTLILISHAHSPPFSPAPRLKFDVRNLPNPPKSVRDAHNGTSKRLQEWMESLPEFIAKRGSIRAEIEKAMDEIVRGGGVENGGENKRENNSKRTSSDEEEEEDSSDPNHEEHASDSDLESSSSSPSGPVLRVGIFCAMGRHRSVAMVELLSRLPWPGWEIQVQHRDMMKKRGQMKKSGGKGSRGMRELKWFQPFMVRTIIKAKRNTLQAPIFLHDFYNNRAG